MIYQGDVHHIIANYIMLDKKKGMS